MKKILVSLLVMLGVGGAAIGGGYYNSVNTNRSQLSILTTTEVTSTTIKTINFDAQTSTLHVVADIIANGTSTGATYHCIAGFKRTSTTVDFVTQIGSTACDTNETNSDWNVYFTTTTGGVKLWVAGAVSSTINWQAYTESYSLR